MEQAIHRQGLTIDGIVLSWPTQPKERIMEHMWELWMSRKPTSTLTKKHLVAYYNNFNRRQLLSKLEIQRLQHCGNNTEKYGHNDPTLVEKSNVTELDHAQPPPITDASTELMMEILTKLPQLTDKVPSAKMLASVNTALCTIPTTCIAEFSECIYNTTTVILESIGYNFKDACRRRPPQRRSLNNKIRESWKDPSWLTKIQKRIMAFMCYKEHQSISYLSIT